MKGPPSSLVLLTMKDLKLAQDWVTAAQGLKASRKT